MLPVNLHNLSSPLKKKKNKDTASSHVLIVKISHGLRTSAGQGGGGGGTVSCVSAEATTRGQCVSAQVPLGDGYCGSLRCMDHGSSNLFHKLAAKPPAAFLAADANLPTPSGNSASTSWRGWGVGGSEVEHDTSLPCHLKLCLPLLLHPPPRWSCAAVRNSL